VEMEPNRVAAGSIWPWIRQIRRRLGRDSAAMVGQRGGGRVVQRLRPTSTPLRQKASCLASG
jgi:hypothetical protein